MVKADLSSEGQEMGAFSPAGLSSLCKRRGESSAGNSRWLTKEGAGREAFRNSVRGAINPATKMESV